MYYKTLHVYLTYPVLCILYILYTLLTTLVYNYISGSKPHFYVASVLCIHPTVKRFIY